MVDGWEVCSLGNLTDNFDSQRVPVKESDRRNGPYPYYGASGIVDWIDDYIFDGEYLLIAEDGENLRSRKTPIAFLADGRFWVNNHAHIVRGNGRALTKFLMYALSNTDIGAYLTGSTIPKLTQQNLNLIQVLTPPLPEQHQIVEILDSIDMAIRLNSRICATLESISSAIFKSWFVDFDPVRAKAEGKKPFGMDDKTAALFPDSFEDSELEEIPKGWGVDTVGSLCASIENGGTPRRIESKYWDGGEIPWFKTGELIDGPLISSEEHITELGLQESSCRLWKPGTVLIALYASPTVGRLGVLEVEGTANQACSALVAKLEIGMPFLFYTLLQARAVLQNIATGAAQQNISQKIVSSHGVVVPDLRIVEKFTETLFPLYRLRVSSARESQILADVRDALLPKLLSGEIRVAAGANVTPINGSGASP